MTGPARLMLAVTVFLATVALVGFLAVWLDTWNGVPDEVEGAPDWWSDFVLPRAAWSLLVGLPVGIALAGLAWRSAGRRG
jgi:hypothetical protein